MGTSYTWEKLHLAVVSLVGKGDIKERVYGAWLASDALDAEPEDFPDAGERERWNNLSERLSSAPAKGNEGTVKATIATMSDDDLQSAAEEFLSLYDAACRRLGAGEDQP